MATKHKHRTKQAAAGLVQQARRELEKGISSRPSKMPRSATDKQPSPEARCLLEQAYLGRCRQLHRAGLRAESQAAAENLLELGVTDQTVRRELPEVLIAVGLSRRLADARPSRLVVGRQQQPPVSGRGRSCRAAARRLRRPCRGSVERPNPIRRALEALEADREAEALALVARHSPRLPVGRLEVFCARAGGLLPPGCGRDARNFDRLAAGRFAARIAAALDALTAGPRRPPATRQTSGLPHRCAGPAPAITASRKGGYWAA